MTRSMLFVGIAVVLGRRGGGAGRGAQARGDHRQGHPRPRRRGEAGRPLGVHPQGAAGLPRRRDLGQPDRGAAPWPLSLERTTSSEGNSTTTLIVLDGEQGWMKTNDHVTPYPRTLIESFYKYTVPYQGPRSILRLRARQKNPACQFATAGEGTVEGRPAVGLRMKLEGGPEATWYFDKETGLLLKTEQRTKRFEGEDQVSVILYGDYQTCDGFPMARKEMRWSDGSWRPRPS